LSSDYVPQPVTEALGKVEAPVTEVIASDSGTGIEKPGMPVQSSLDLAPIQTGTGRTKIAVETQARAVLPADEVPQSVTEALGKVEVPVAEMSASDTGSKIEKPGMPVQSSPDMQAGIDAPTAEASQPVVKVVGLDEDSHVAETRLKIDNDQSAMSSNIHKTTNEVRMGSANKSGVIDTSSLSTPVTGQTNAPALFQSDSVTQVLPSQDHIKTSQVKRTNEKTPPDETQQESSQATEPSSTIIGSAKETVAAKVVEKLSTTQANPQASEVVQQIMNHIKTGIKNGETSIRLQLNPKELGAIEVHMISNAQGVSVTFFAEQASTGQLLAMQMNQLRQSLQEAGVQLAGLNISQHDQPNQEGGFFKQSPHFGQYSQRDAPQTETANEERMRPARIDGLTSEIDYLI
jgi:flagellar hook-length control protein FliK